MVRPRLIIVVRHAQSEGNKNRDIHQMIPDHRVKLTPLGWQQAHEAGRKLRSMLRPDDTLQVFTSPYRRTRETTEGILSTLTADDAETQEPSQWQRDAIRVYDEPRLREQDFGNFQPCSAEMERMWQERADYGHFFYRIPNGESAADAYDRVSGFNESLWRQFGEDNFASVCVLVTHGLMSRVFLMKWYHFTVEYFEDLRNINHCEFLTMRKQEETGKYILENNLRTWSELRQERLEEEMKKLQLQQQQQQQEEQQQQEQQQNGNGDNSHHHHQEEQSVVPKEKGGLTRNKTFVPLRRWGGCPNGCNHGRTRINMRDDLEVLRMKDTKEADGSSRRAAGVGAGSANGNGTTVKKDDKKNGVPAAGHSPSPSSSSSFDDDDQAGSASEEFQAKVSSVPQIDLSKATETGSDISSPAGTPSFISADDRHMRALKSPHYVHLHVGRDGGGTYSGHASVACSEDELSSSDEDHRRHRHHHDHHHGGQGASDSGSDGAASPNGAAPALGGGGGGGGDDAAAKAAADAAMDKAEKADRSIMGSVY